VQDFNIQVCNLEVALAKFANIRFFKKLVGQRKSHNFSVLLLWGKVQAQFS